MLLVAREDTILKSIIAVTHIWEKNVNTVKENSVIFTMILPGMWTIYVCTVIEDHVLNVGVIISVLIVHLYNL